MQTISLSLSMRLVTLLSVVTLGTLPLTLMQLSSLTSVRLYTKDSGSTDDRGSGRVTLVQTTTLPPSAHSWVAFRGSGRIDDDSHDQVAPSAKHSLQTPQDRASTLLAFRGSGRICQMNCVAA